MWSFEHTQNTTASPEQIWAYYAATDLAPTWDPVIKRIEVHGPFVQGTKGHNHPVGGGRFPFEYTEVTPLRSYTEVTKAPFARLAFTHTITSTPEGSAFTHGVQITGTLAWLYTLLQRKSYQNGLPKASQNLARLLEQQPLPVSETQP